MSSPLFFDDPVNSLKPSSQVFHLGAVCLTSARTNVGLRSSLPVRLQKWSTVLGLARDANAELR